MPVAPEEEAEVVVLADQAGFPLLETLDETLSGVLRRLDAGRPVHLVLCNPDLIYPKAPGRYGLTAGALAALVEAVLAQRYRDPPAFVRLGKPYPALFEEAARRAGTRDLVMVGDQIATDVRGARGFGIAAALVGSGLAAATAGANEWPEAPNPERGTATRGEGSADPDLPDWLLDSLVLDPAAAVPRP